MKLEKRVLFVSDVHTPYEDHHAVDLIKAAAVKIEPTHIVFGGDIIDFYSLSRFAKEKPTGDSKALHDTNYASWWLHTWRDAFPKAHMKFIHGNHEWRYQRYLREKAPAIYGMEKNLDVILGLKEMKIETYPHNGSFDIGKLTYVHGDNWPTGYGSVNPAKAVFDRTRESIIFGHFHRFSMFRHKAFSGKEVGAWGNGCLCEDQEYDPCANWQRGASIVVYSRSGYYRVLPLEIVAGKLLYPCQWEEA